MIKLAWALIWIMKVANVGDVQRNDLSIDNIMLHWELDDSMNIEVCNWGCVTHVGDMPNQFGIQKGQALKEQMMRGKFWVACGWHLSCFTSIIGRIRL